MKSFRYRSYRPETSNKHSSQIRIRGAFKERHLSALWDNLEPRAMLTKLLRNLKMDCVVWVVHLLNTHFLGSVSCMSFFIRNNSYGSLDFREVAFSSCSPRQVLTFVLGSKGGVCLKAMGTCRSGNRAVVIMNSSCLTVLSLNCLNSSNMSSLFPELPSDSNWWTAFQSSQISVFMTACEVCWESINKGNAAC